MTVRALESTLMEFVQVLLSKELGGTSFVKKLLRFGLCGFVPRYIVWAVLGVSFALKPKSGNRAPAIQSQTLKKKIIPQALLNVKRQFSGEFSGV